MTFTYRCELPASDNRSGGQRISCILPPDFIAFGPCGPPDAGAADSWQAEWARSWDAALRNLREVVEALE